MAPEILLGDVFNEKVDVFSYAMCLVELIDCHLPWHGVAVGAAITIKVSQGQRPEAQVNGDRAREMGALVQVRFGPQMIQVGPYRIYRIYLSMGPCGHIYLVSSIYSCSI